MAALSAAEQHYVLVQREQALSLAVSRRAWAKVDPNNISASWSRLLTAVTPIVEASQARSAWSGAAYPVMDLAQRGTYVEPLGFVNPEPLVGMVSGGTTLESRLYSPATTSKSWIASGYTAKQSLDMSRSILDGIVRTSISDAGRQAASVDIASRPGVGYVRMLNPPSCDSCTILAGRFYRWNKGFLRHPKCDCIHRPSTSIDAAKSEGLIDDPYEYFNGMSEADQNKAFGKNKAQAIRDGGDIYRVQNSWRGRDGLKTFAGTSKRGFASDLKGRRLTPDGIYLEAAGDRAKAIGLLQEHGYLIGQQRAGGIVAGQVEGFGALGRGGTRKGASQAVLDARRTGVRNESMRATMTSAERRLYDSKARYDAALAGQNPYGRGSATALNTATAETDYRRWLATNGEIYPS